MKRVISLLLSFIIILGLVGCSSKTPTPDNLISKSEEEVLDYGVLFRNEALELMRYKSNLNGFSIVGNSSDKDKVSYIKERMTEIGLENVAEEPIVIDGWDFEGISMTFACDCTESGIQKFYKVGSYPSTYSFNEDIVQLVNVGDVSNISSNDIKGKGVLINSSKNLKESVELAKSKGASFLIYPYISDYSVTTYKVDIEEGLPVDIPVFVLSKVNYDLLVKSTALGSEIPLTLTGESNLQTDIESSFVVGEIKGKKSDEFIYITANRDSIEQGFMSSSVNIAELFTLADSLISEKYKPLYTIRFLVTTGHEWGSVEGGLNKGIEQYLKGIDTSKIKYSIVLDGSKPIMNEVLNEIQISESQSSVKDALSKYNEVVKENNNKFKTIVNSISNANITEGLVWDSYGVPTIIQAEPINTKYYMLENTSADSVELLLDSDYCKYLIDYYIGVIKLLNN